MEVRKPYLISDMDAFFNLFKVDPEEFESVTRVMMTSLIDSVGDTPERRRKLIFFETEKR